MCRCRRAAAGLHRDFAPLKAQKVAADLIYRDVDLDNREYELPEAVGVAMTRGVVFQTFRASGPVLDLSRRSDVSLVNARLAGLEPRP